MLHRHKRRPRHRRNRLLRELFLVLRRPLLATLAEGTADPKTAKPDPKKKKNEAPDTKDDPAATHKQQIVDLLEASHAANDEVLPDQKATLLARQISMISRLNSDSAEKWAQELFQLGDDQADDQKRARMQVMAIQMVAQGDPEFGLKLLHQIKPVAETDLDGPGFRQHD